MAQLMKCKCGNYLSDCSCVITKMDLRTPPTMKEQMERPKREEFIIEYKNQPISPTMYVRTDWQQYSKALEAYIDHLTAEREMKEHNIRELLIHFIDSIRDYESESHNNIGFDDRESDELVDIYLKHNPEILSHHLTAEQGDCPHSPFDWEGRCTICGEQLFTAPQPQELTVREVSDEEIQSMANKYIESNRFIECANVAENSYIAGLENMRDKMNSLKS